MALSPDKQALLDALLAEQAQPESEPTKLFHDVYDVLEFLVHHSTAFSGNEPLRQEAKDAIHEASGKNEVHANDGETQ